jgi:hypothetical protein
VSSPTQAGIKYADVSAITGLSAFADDDRN